MMKRFALFAFAMCFGAQSFCQTPAINSETASPQFDKPHTPELFGLNIDQLGLATPPQNPGDKGSCNSSKATLDRPRRPVDTNRFFRLPCMDSRTFADVAQIHSPTSPAFLRLGSGAKGIPIQHSGPTQELNRSPHPGRI